jgi:hypothetical protein
MDHNDSIINEFIKPFTHHASNDDVSKGIERRLYVRKEVQWKATVDNFIHEKPCSVTNVSSRGARIISQSDLGKGAHVELKIMANINGQDVIISAPGEAKHILIDGDIFIGIEFFRLEKDTQEILDAFVSS